jgi:circadian clock protein KaiB
VKPVIVDGMPQGKTKAPKIARAPKIERAPEPAAPHYLLRLFVTGTTPRSARAIQNIRAICEAYLPSRYDLEVIDIYQHPEHVKAEQIVVTPTLVRHSPHPVRKLIGDLSDTERVLAGLDIAPRPISARPPGTEHAA